MPTKRLLIKGKVQGVFYRATAKNVAEGLNITGWIKNTAAGDVEAVVSGSQNNLDDFTSWCKTGPRNAVVKDVIVEEEQDEIFESFSIIHD